MLSYFRNYKGHRFASTKQAVETSEAFRRKVFDFAKCQDIPIHRFAKGERKDDVMHGFLKDFRDGQGVVFIGVAQALFAVLILLSLKIEGFRNRQLRPLLAQMLGSEEAQITQGRMTYDLRRLHLHGLIERIETTHRYQLTKKGLGVVYIYQRTYSRLLRPLLSTIDGGCPSGNSPEAKALKRIQSAIDTYIDDQAA